VEDQLPDVPRAKEKSIAKDDESQESEGFQFLLAGMEQVQMTLC